MDDFEEIIVTDSHESCFVDESGSCIDHLGKEYMSPKDPDNASCRCELDGVSSYEKSQTGAAVCLNSSQSSTTLDHTQNREQGVVDQNHTHVDSGAHNSPCCSGHDKMSSTMNQDSPSCNPCSSFLSKSPKWTRYRM